MHAGTYVGFRNNASEIGKAVYLNLTMAEHIKGTVKILWKYEQLPSDAETLYYEEYDSIPQNKNMGDLKMSVVQYRLFCDFEGLPIRRNRFKYFNADCCSPMTEKWKRVLRKSISDNPKEYASFMKFLRVPKEVKGHVTLKYVVSEKDKDKVIRSMEAIRENLPPKFTFFDLKHIAEDNHCVINMNNFIDDVSYDHMYIRIFLVYTFGDSIGKRVLFHKLDYEIREK